MVYFFYSKGRFARKIVGGVLPIVAMIAIELSLIWLTRNLLETRFVAVVVVVTAVVAVATAVASVAVELARVVAHLRFYALLRRCEELVPVHPLHSRLFFDRGQDCKILVSRTEDGSYRIEETSFRDSTLIATYILDTAGLFERWDERSPAGGGRPGELYHANALEVAAMIKELRTLMEQSVKRTSAR